MNTGVVEATGLASAFAGAALARRCAPPMLAAAATAGVALAFVPA